MSPRLLFALVAMVCATALAVTWMIVGQDGGNERTGRNACQFTTDC